MKQYECFDMSSEREDMKKWYEDTPENREYLAKLGFAYDAREIYNTYGKALYFTSYLFGVRKFKNMNNNRGGCWHKSFFENCGLEYGVDYVLIKNKSRMGRGHLPERNALLTQFGAERMLLDLPKTRDTALENLMTLLNVLNHKENSLQLYKQ